MLLGLVAPDEAYAQTQLSLKLSTKSINVYEGTDRRNYTVRLETQPTDNMPVTIMISSNNTDVTISSDTDSGTFKASTLLTFTASNWKRPRTVWVKAAHDDDFANETVMLTHTASGSGYGSVTCTDTCTVTATVKDDDGPALVFSRSTISVSEGGTGNYTVQLATQPTTDVTVAIAITPSNSDVTVNPTSLTFMASNWNSAQIVTVTAAQDDDTANDTATLTHDPSGGGYDSVAAGTVTVTVTDDDGGSANQPPLLETPMSEQTATAGSAFNYILPTNTFIDKDGDSLTYTAKLLTNNVEGSLPGWLSFDADTRTFSGTPGSGDTGMLPIRVWADDSNGGMRSGTFILTVSAATNNVPTASFGSASSSAAENAGTRSVNVNLSSAAPSGGLTLSYGVTGTATAGSDFTIRNSGTVSIAAGDSSATIPVAINDDNANENAETVILTLTGGTGYTLGSTRVHTLTITDNDDPLPNTPVVSIQRTGGSAITEGSTVTFTLTATPAPPSPITVNVDITATGDVVAAGQTGTRQVTLTGGTATFTVTTDNDQVSESSGVITARIATGPGYSPSGSQGTASVTINDDDGVSPGRDTPDPNTPGSDTTDPDTPLVPIRPSITISADSTSVEEGTPAGFTVSASTAPTSPLTIRLRVNETTGQDFIDTSNEGSQTLTLPAGETSVPYPVPTVDDTTEESDGQVMVTVEPGTDYRIPSTSSSASVTITDNDRHEITFASDAGRVREGGVHTITLHIDPAPTSPLSLRYRLSGTATQGTDYRVQTGTPGVLQIPAGSTRALIRIQSLADEEEDAGETVILHLMGGSGLSLGAVYEHVLTLVDRKEASLEAGRGWLVRFGRTVAEQGLDSIAQRLRAPRSAGTRVSLGGRELAFTGQDTRQEAQAYTPFLQNYTDLHTDLHNDVPPSTQQSLSLHEVLQGSHFLSVGETDAYGGSLAFWGRAAHSSFDGKENTVSLDGDSTAVLLGGDYALGPWLGGITLSHSEGDGDYRESGTPGDIEASLTSLLPWLSLQATERLQVWGALGIGEGDMHLEPEGGEKLRTDIDWTLAGAGVRSALLSSQTGLSLSLVGDVLWMETDAKEINGLSVASAGVSRVRLGLEGQYAMALADGTRLIPRLELGVREDEGDAESGAGVELGGGIAWSDPHRGLTLELAGRTLITHDSNDLEDKGISVSLDYDPIPGSARGLSLALHQEMGTASTGGLEALFASAPLTTHTDPTTDSYTDKDTDQELESRLRLEAAYGLVAFDGRFIAGPQAALSHSPAVQDYSLGWRLVPSARHQDLSLQITALRREQDQEPPEHATTLEMIARW